MAGSLLQSFSVQTPYPIGITHDGRSIFVFEDIVNTIYQHDVNGGQLIRAFTCSTGGIQGLAFNGKSLLATDYALDSFVNLNIVTGRVIRSVSTPFNNPDNIGFNGKDFLLNYNTGNKVYICSVINGTIIKSFDTSQSYNCVFYDGRAIWMFSPTTDLIYQIDPITGTIITSMSSPDTGVVGITTDGFSLWLVGRQNAKVYQLSL